MKLTDVTELTECKARCRGDQCGAFVVTGDVCRFCPKKVPGLPKPFRMDRWMGLPGGKVDVRLEMGRGTVEDN